MADGDGAFDGLGAKHSSQVGGVLANGVAVLGDLGTAVAAPVDGRFLPERPLVIWTAEERESLYSGHISGVQHPPHGGFLVCDGEGGRFLEVAADGSLLWEFVSSVGRREGADGPPS